MRVPTEIESWLRARSGSLAEWALLEAQQDARRAKATAWRQRDAAQRDRLQHLRRAADRLAQVARAGIAGAVLQGGCGLASSAALLGKIGASDPGTARWLDAVGRVADSVARVDPFRAAAMLHDSERAVDRLSATRAEHAAQRADDQLRQAGRLSAGYLDRLRNLVEDGHAAEMALLRR